MKKQEWQFAYKYVYIVHTYKEFWVNDGYFNSKVKYKYVLQTRKEYKSTEENETESIRYGKMGQKVFERQFAKTKLARTGGRTTQEMTRILNLSVAEIMLKIAKHNG